MVPHFRDETYRDIKALGYNVRGCIIRGLNVQGHNVQGRIVPCTIICTWQVGIRVRGGICFPKRQ
jgi:hypothetical protein